jgi:molybdopterin molybdotransferase
MKLLEVDSVEAARSKLAGCVAGWRLSTLFVPADEALGMILAEDIAAGEDIPGFRRSTVDGYAVMAKDTAAAGENIPVLLNVAGQVSMGRAADFSLRAGQCASVPTGGMLPEGADGVVMMEYAEPFGEAVALYQSAAPGENVVERDEDVSKGALVLERGRRIGPREIGALAALGVTLVPVYKPLKLAVISTGDELVAPDAAPPGPGQVRDINTYALTALARKNGFETAHTAVLRDDAALLENELRNAMAFCDIVAVSGGSSQGEKDMTGNVIQRVSDPGVFTHGMAIKPGKPTILGYDQASLTLFVGLPGHPVSAMLVFETLLCDLWRKMTGAAQPPPVPAALTVNVPSSPGKTTCQPVKLAVSGKGYLAEPVFGKSGLITTLTQADGYFVIEREAEGLTAGSRVYVHLF